MRLSRREAIWAFTVGVVLADSSVVTLALPEIIAEFDTSVFGVSWVLTSFNLVLALAVLPLARRASARPGGMWVVGCVVFAATSLLCGVAPSAEFLIVARCLQAAGGAAVIAGAIELLAASRGSHLTAAPAWGTAGLIGLAVGPAAGGFLTELLSWQSIFLVQVPLMLAPVPAVGRAEPARRFGPSGEPELKPEISLGLLSAGLAGALFLLVIMLTEGWRFTPLEAAFVVSVIPLAAVIAERIGGRLPAGLLVMAGGAVFVAGGLAALGVVPGAHWGWTLAPQAMVGAGLALAIPGLTSWALETRDRGGRRSAATIAARHAGVVLGLLVLTPIFTVELERATDSAESAGTALLLDAPLSPGTKVELAEAVAQQIEEADGRLPEVAPAFEAVEADEENQAELDELRVALEEEVEKGATSAFSLSFLAAALLALGAVIPLALSGRRR